MRIAECIYVYAFRFRCVRGFIFAQVQLCEQNKNNSIHSALRFIHNSNNNKANAVMLCGFFKY